MSILVAILVFGLLVLFHELGHFLLAKKNGIKVEEFSIGMGPRLLHFTKGETIYSIKLLPLGGSCLMLGEDEASSDSQAFNNKSVWARIAVVAAGPIFNFILAFILAMFVTSFVGAQKPVIKQIVDHSAAQEAGLQVGDKILRLDQKKIRIFPEVSLFLQTNPDGAAVQVTYERDGVQNVVTVVPKKNEEGSYLFGIIGGRFKASAVDIVKYSFYEVKYCIEAVVKSLGMLISGHVSANEISGPVGIVNVIGNTYAQAKKINMLSVILSLANMATLLSANLGVMNLLPIPALDGGRLVFFIIEAICGKRISAEKEGMVHFIGFCALMLLMVFLFANDIRMLFIR